MDGKQVKNISNPTGTGKYLDERGKYVSVPIGGATLTEIEIDFGLDPISSKTFTITDTNVTDVQKVLPFTSPNPATGRIGNDWELDMPFMTAIAQTGSVLITISFNHLVVGKRKIYYQIIN